MSNTTFLMLGLVVCAGSGDDGDGDVLDDDDCGEFRQASYIAEGALVDVSCLE